MIFHVIVFLVKCATTIQLHVEAIIFTIYIYIYISLLSSVLTLVGNTNVVVHGRDNL